MAPPIEVDPKQPDEVVEQLVELVVPPQPEPDPWWRAGVQETLGT